MQANEVIKYITKTGDILAGRILIFDAQTLQSRIIKIGEVTGAHITRLVETIFVPVISAADLRTAIKDNAVELIDVRTAEEREEFDIGGQHIPMDQLYFQINNLDKETKTVLYCASGKRSAEAVKLIKKRFPDAPFYSLDGGLKSWLETVV